MNKIKFSPAFVLMCAAGLLILTFFFSCDLLRDGVFEVSGWSPGTGFHDPVPAYVSLHFSLSPDRISVERAFSLSENEKALAGSFRWDGSVFYFFPAAPLEKNRGYLVSLGTEAQDTKGLSLERRFEAVFSTRPQSSRPLLLESAPADGGIIIQDREKIRLRFSEAMERSSFQSLSFSPSVSGVWALENGGLIAEWTPSEAWVNGRKYRLDIGPELLSARGLAFGKTESLHFSAGIDHEAPALTAAYAVHNNVRVMPLAASESEQGLYSNSGFVPENLFWERGYNLELVFSKPVDPASITGALSTEPSFGWTMLPPADGGSAFIFHFNSEPVWNSSFMIHINNSVRDFAGNTMSKKMRFYIRADGPASKPPSLKGIRLLLDPAAERTMVSHHNEHPLDDFPLDSAVFQFDTGKPYWMELYFDTASGQDGNAASINVFSLMERFKFSATNGALSFSPREIRSSNFSIPDAEAGWENYSRLEIRGVLTNHPYTGLVTIETGAGLEDSFGNKSTETFRILLIK